MENIRKEKITHETTEKSGVNIPTVSQNEKIKFARGVHGGELYIEDYDPSWPNKAKELMKEMAGIFSDAVLIKHVGSTSVVGMSAKPVLDILVSLQDFDTIDCYTKAIEAVGFKLYGAFNSDHRTFYREDPVTGFRLAHIHVCKSGSEVQKSFEALSDYCNAVPEAREAYSLLKKALILRYKDRPEKYGPAKKQFLLDLTDDAIAWKKQQECK